MIVGQQRGSFPKSATHETPEQQRERWERWVVETHNSLTAASGDARHIDPEFDAVMAQPGYSPMSRPSQVQAVRARCWQCQSGDDDDAGTVRIADCASQDCALWSVRPYQDEATKPPRRLRGNVSREGFAPLDWAGKALANPGNRSIAVRGYCHQCCGGRPDMTATREVKDCKTATCALWRARDGARQAIATPPSRVNAAFPFDDAPR